MDEPIEIFFSYAHEDDVLMDAVRRQLIVYERNNRILKWHDRMIQPGTEWEQEIDERLLEAAIILLFVSPHFLESKYCYETEVEVALDRHARGDAHVVPVILRPCAWEEAPFSDFQALPGNAKPVSTWDNQDLACLNVARGVMTVVDDIAQGGPPSRNHPPECREKGENPRSHSVTAGELEAFVYCRRCGTEPGEQSTCTTPFTHHDFVMGSTQDYCQRCGQRVGSRSQCTGPFTHHSFKNKSSA